MTSLDFLHRPVTCREGAEAYIRSLVDADLLYHFDEDAHSVVWGRDDVTPGMCDAMNRRCSELYGAVEDWGEHGCPIGYALRVLEVKRETEGALARLKERGVGTTMTSQALTRLMRG